MRLWVAIVALSVLVPDIAQACSCNTRCGQHILVPRPGTIPANSGGIGVYLPGAFAGSEISATDVATMERLVTTEEKYDLSSQIVFAQFAEGRTYELRVEVPCEHQVVLVSDVYTAGPRQPVPTRLGRVEVITRGEAETGRSQGAGCGDSQPATFVDVELVLAPVAEPWRDSFMYETWVDGERWHHSTSACGPGRFGNSWRGRAKDRIVVFCRPLDRVSAGIHTVHFVAKLPRPDGTLLELETAPERIQLECPKGASNGCRCTATPPSPTWTLFFILLVPMVFARLRPAGPPAKRNQAAETRAI